MLEKNYPVYPVNPVKNCPFQAPIGTHIWRGIIHLLFELKSRWQGILL
jgi:hypothetical protein